MNGPDLVLQNKTLQAHAQCARYNYTRPPYGTMKLPAVGYNQHRTKLTKNTEYETSHYKDASIIRMRQDAPL